MKSKPLSCALCGKDENSSLLGEAKDGSNKFHAHPAQKPLRTPQFQAFVDSLEPQLWKRKKLSPNWATCHFNPVPK